MKINKLETHDRLLHYRKQDSQIGECCQHLINQRPFGTQPFYIFAHARTLGLDERLALFRSGKYSDFSLVPEKTLIWQPRLTKPKAQTNSMLFKGYPGTDKVKVIWIIPPREMWDQFKRGLITENKTICDSIENFQFNRSKLEEPDADDRKEDLNESQINAVYKSLAGKPKSKSLVS